MNVLTDKELRAIEIRGAVTAIAILSGVMVAAWFLEPRFHQFVVAHVGERDGAPVILKQTDSKTVARIPTMHGGVRVDCTVTIDQAKNVWSITC